MILVIIGALLSICIPLFIYIMILRKKEKVNTKSFVITFILGATLYTLPIIVLELLWDFFFKTDAKNLSVAFSQGFLRAALIEETVKYLFCFLTLKRKKDLSLREAVLLLGLIGVGYGFTEKLAYGAGGALIVNAICPGHLLFQWIMAYFMYQGFKMDKKNSWKMFILAFIVPYVIHGTWDFLMDFLTDYLLGTPLLEVLNLIFFVILVGMMISAIVIIAVRLRKLSEVKSDVTA